VKAGTLSYQAGTKLRTKTVNRCERIEVDLADRKKGCAGDI
jgi:hypothetical protein